MTSNSRPLVSVIVPTRNRSKLLVGAVDSVYAQEGAGGLFDLEVVVVDTASSDETPALVRHRYPRARYIRLRDDPLPPLSAARNEGFFASTGSYVAFLDDDDYFLPEKMRLQVPILVADPDAGVVYSQFSVVFDGRPRAPGPDPSRAPSGWIFPHLLMNCSTQLSGALIRREAIDRVGPFDERFSYMDDIDLWLRLAFHFPFRFVPGTVSMVRFSRDGLSVRKVERGFEEGQRVFDRALSAVQDDEARARLSVEARARYDLFHVSRFVRRGQFEWGRRFLQRALETLPEILLEAETQASMVSLSRTLAVTSNSPVEEINEVCGTMTKAAGKWGVGRRLAIRRLTGEMWRTAAVALGKTHPFAVVQAARAAGRAISLDPANATRLLWYILRAFRRTV